MILTTTILTSCVKVLLMPSYRSTDFEVHRNWLAITYNLPVKEWYFENTSEWTLDYPPLFAWFEFILGHVAKYFDENMLKLDALNYASEATILFQRLSVIVTDLVYVYGVYRCCSTFQQCWKRNVVLPILMVTNCGLIMVDHIHFQYNGILNGILLISLSYVMKGNTLKAAFWFAILFNMKHIYLYFAPAYFVYMLRLSIKKNVSLKNIFSLSTISNIAQLGGIVLLVTSITYIPFYDQMPQVLSRLFPFKRGLTHAYWAPNAWALYNVLDKIVYSLLQKTGLQLGLKSTATMTGGLVQNYSHSILPSITPLMTICITLVMMCPALVKVFLSPKPVNFVRCVVLCGLTSFMFGWHVHEKAILMAIIPLSLLSVMDQPDGKIFLILSTIGHYSLFPLLFPPSLVLVKALLLFLYSSYAFYSISKVFPSPVCRYALPLLTGPETAYLLGLAGLYLYENVIHVGLGLDAAWPFLPLLLTSVYCGLGVAYCWGYYYGYFLILGATSHVKQKNKVN